MKNGSAGSKNVEHYWLENLKLMKSFYRFKENIKKRDIHVIDKTISFK